MNDFKVSRNSWHARLARIVEDRTETNLCRYVRAILLGSLVALGILSFLLAWLFVLVNPILAWLGLWHDPELVVSGIALWIGLTMVATICAFRLWRSRRNRYDHLDRELAPPGPFETWLADKKERVCRHVVIED